jgi:hypothetical protein
MPVRPEVLQCKGFSLALRAGAAGCHVLLTDDVGSGVRLAGSAANAKSRHLVATFRSWSNSDGSSAALTFEPRIMQKTVVDPFESLIRHARPSAANQIPDFTACPE